MISKQLFVLLLQSIHSAVIISPSSSTLFTSYLIIDTFELASGLKLMCSSCVLSIQRDMKLGTWSKLLVEGSLLYTDHVDQTNADKQRMLFSIVVVIAPNSCP